jgi:outer membrane protein
MRNRFVPFLAAGALAGAPLLAQQPQTPPIEPRIQATPLPPPVVLPPPPEIPADVPNRPLTAEEAAAIALRHQSDVAAAAANLQAAGGRERQARSGLKPSVGLSAGYTHLDSLSGSASSASSGGSGGVGSSGYTAAITGSQLLFDFNHTRDVAREASALREGAAANLTRVQADLVLQTKQGFYTLLQNTRLVSVNEANLAAQQAHVALARARLEAGFGLPSDVVRAETAVSEAALDLNLARNAAALSRVDLNTLMGTDPRTPIEPADSSEPQPGSLDVNALVDTALRRRPEMVQADAEVRAAEAGESAARSSNAPSVSADVGLNTRGRDFPPGNNSLTVGASIRWDVFDAGATAGLVQEARGNLAAVRAAREGTRQDVVADVSAAYLNLVSAEQRVQTTEAQVANAQESVRLAEGRYRGGLGTFLDVTDAQSALLAAQTGSVNARTAVDQARAALARATGAP